MTYFKIGLYLIFGIILFSSCTSEENNKQSLDSDLMDLLKTQSPSGNVSYFELPESKDFHKIPQDPKNPLTLSKVALGGFLFHETALATESKQPVLSQTYSCATCHHSNAGFQSGSLQGYGDGGTGFGLRGELRTVKSNITDPDVSPLKSPSVLNAAYQPNQMWNGQFGSTHLNTNTQHLWLKNTDSEINNLGYQGIESRAIAGLKMHRLKISENIIKMGAYKKLFDESFSEIAENKRYSQETTGLAIAAYLRTLTADKAPFQKYLKGDESAISSEEKNGALLFFGKAKCINCHTGPALNTMQFNAIGMKDLVDCPEPTINTKQNDPANLGRGGFTKNTADNYKFKVPQLYNLADSPYFGHGSSFKSIKDVIKYKNAAISENKNITKEHLDPLFKPLGLTEEEINAITAFITKALYDPNLSRFVPQKLPSGLCFPNADLQSRRDMDCY